MMCATGRRRLVSWPGGIARSTYSRLQKLSYTHITCLNQDRLPGALAMRGAGFGIRRVAVTQPSYGDVLPGAVLLSVDSNLEQQCGEPGLWRGRRRVADQRVQVGQRAKRSLRCQPRRGA